MEMASRASSPATANGKCSEPGSPPFCPPYTCDPAPAVAPIPARPIPSARLDSSAWLARCGRVSTALPARAAMIVSPPSAWAQARMCSACAATSRAAMLVGRATRLDRLAPARPFRTFLSTQRARPPIPPPAATMAFATALARAPSTRKNTLCGPSSCSALSRIRPGLATARELAGIPTRELLALPLHRRRVRTVQDRRGLRDRIPMHVANVNGRNHRDLRQGGFGHPARMPLNASRASAWTA